MAGLNYTSGAKATTAPTLVERDGAAGASSTSSGTGGTDDLGSIDSSPSLIASSTVMLNLSAPPASKTFALGGTDDITGQGGAGANWDHHRGGKGRVRRLPVDGDF